MKLMDLGGKYVSVKTDDGQIFNGFVESVESELDSDDGIASIDIIHSKQFPMGVTLRNDEIISIKIINSKDMWRLNK